MNSQDKSRESNNRRVLLVDDDEIFLSLLTIVLERDGWVVTARTDRQGAMAAATEDPAFIALVCDFELGHGETGVAVAAGVGSIAPAIRPVVISGHREEIVRAESASVEFQFLQKPFDPPALLTLLHGYVEAIDLGN